MKMRFSPCFARIRTSSYPPKASHRQQSWAACDSPRLVRRVLTTLHVETATGFVDRVVGAFNADMQPQVRAMLASSLQEVVVMRLVPLADGSGRVPVCEILIRTDGLPGAIMAPKENSTESALYQIIDSGKKLGMTFLEDELALLVADEKITEAVAYEYAARPNKLKDKIDSARAKSPAGGKEGFVV